MYNFSVEQLLKDIASGDISPIFILVGVLVINSVVHIWKKYIRSSLDAYAEKLRTKGEKEKVIKSKLQQIAIESGHFSMSQLLKKCHQRGYRDDNDREAFMRLYKNYLSIDGDTDSEVMYHDFINIPYEPSLRLPVKRGSVLPDEEVMNDLIGIYRGISNSKVKRSSLQRIVKLIEDDMAYNGNIESVKEDKAK